MMKQWNIFILITLFFAISCDGQNNNNSSPFYQKSIEKSNRVVQSVKLTNHFMQTLQKKLLSALKASGRKGAIEMCKTGSPALEKEFQAKDKDIVSFRRISLKPRNTKSHTPNEMEKVWLLDIDKMNKARKKLLPGIIKQKDKTTVLIPIVIKKRGCLICHGKPKTMDDKLKEIFKKDYPDDQSPGYKIGDISGALSIEWKNQ